MRAIPGGPSKISGKWLNIWRIYCPGRRRQYEAVLFHVLVAAPGGEVLTYWESGHPDEYDIWELITRDARYRKAAELLEESVEVRVSHYIYETESPGRMHMRSRAILICWTPITSWPAAPALPV